METYHQHLLKVADQPQNIHTSRPEKKKLKHINNSTTIQIALQNTFDQEFKPHLPNNSALPRLERLRRES